MSAAELIAEIVKLPSDEQKKVLAFLAGKVVTDRNPDAKRWVGKRLSFKEACDVVFRENRELLALLAR